MRKLEIAVVGLVALWLVVFVVNYLGWNLLLYTNLGSRDLVLAAADGQCQIAWAEATDPAAITEDMERLVAWDDYSYKRLVDVGPFFAFAETSTEPFRPFGIRFMPPHPELNYVEIVVPGLVPLALLIAISGTLRSISKPSPTSRRARKRAGKSDPGVSAS